MRTRQRPGHRGRIGIVQPAPGVMLEYEWPSRLPSGVLFPLARIRMTGGTSADFAAIAAKAPDAACDLVSAGADVIGYACSVGSLYAGASAEQELVGAMEKASQRPVVSISAASMLALKRLGVQRLAILSPYSADTNAQVASYAREHGLDVTGVATTPVGIAEVGNLPPQDIVDVALEALRCYPDAQGLWVPCTAVRTLEAIAAIERRSGRVVVSGSQALLWATLRAIGIEDAIPKTGRLLA